MDILRICIDGKRLCPISDLSKRKVNTVYRMPVGLKLSPFIIMVSVSILGIYRYQEMP